MGINLCHTYRNNVRRKSDVKSTSYGVGARKRDESTETSFSGLFSSKERCYMLSRHIRWEPGNLLFVSESRKDHRLQSRKKFK